MVFKTNQMLSITAATAHRINESTMNKKPQWRDKKNVIHVVLFNLYFSKTEPELAPFSYC
jgi:hypothetical protein